ncbi:MAG TPA: lipid-A-disaccharide synthase [Gemmatimonadaceae bacterium]|nr:lipid-A-disaccharide synthase [Gemmatimonadaceae bacterium]
MADMEVLVVAGEASGDLHAAGVVRELRALRPDVTVAGVGGDRMREAGVELVEHAERLAVMGFAEVLRHVPKHWMLLRELEGRLRSGRVRLLILLDYPGFNMKVAAAAKRAGVPVLYYITPQVWAWGAGRIPKLAELVTKAAVIFRFEEELLRPAGVDVSFVGHPLLDRIGELPSRADACRQLGLDAARPVLALFPGSRGQEIARHLDAFVATARELERRVPGLQVIVSGAPTIRLDDDRLPYPVARGASPIVLRAATAAMCKSGTTTLEAAVAGCPLVVAYRTSPVTYRIARRVVRIPFIGLVNIVAGREVAPEFVQESLEPGRVADALEPLLDAGSEARASMCRGLAEVRAQLGEPGAAARVARIAADLLA